METADVCECGNRTFSSEPCTECRWRAEGKHVTYDYNVCDEACDDLYELWTEHPIEAYRAYQRACAKWPKERFVVVRYPIYRPTDNPQDMQSDYCCHRSFTGDAVTLELLQKAFVRPLELLTYEVALRITVDPKRWSVPAAWDWEVMIDPHARAGMHFSLLKAVPLATVDAVHREAIRAYDAE